MKTKVVFLLGICVCIDITWDYLSSFFGLPSQIQTLMIVASGIILSGASTAIGLISGGKMKYQVH